MTREQWNNAFQWAKALGQTDEEAVRGADRRAQTERVRQAALHERFNEYGLPRDGGPIAEADGAAA